jgi:hypothetical protein
VPEFRGRVRSLRRKERDGDEKAMMDVAVGRSDDFVPLSFRAVPVFVENFGPSHASQPPLSDCRKRMPSHGHGGPSN